MIPRPTYLQQLIDNQGRQIIKVVTGVRRCGKSTLFELYKNWLKSTGVKENQIISVNLEDLNHAELLDYKKLHAHITQRLTPNQQNYVFIDEIQNCKNFEKAVNSLFIRPQIDLHITGSNAYMLSGELATLLSGRYITINMLPLLFSEYYQYRKEQNPATDTRQAFNDYLRWGSFPYLAGLPRTQQATGPYLEGIYHTILLKDVAKRQGITDINVLENIVLTLASSTGSPISAKKIADTLGSAGRKISPHTVDTYLRALTDSFLFYAATRYDIKGRQHLKTLGKYYLVDWGLRNFLLASHSPDIGHAIENLVFLELKRRGARVNIGKLASKEVDFVAQNLEQITYYQVCASVLAEETLARELAPLQEIPDHHPKILLTLDEVAAGSNHNGIRQLNLIDWLLDI